MKQQHHLLVVERKTARESNLIQRGKEGEEIERDREGRRGGEGRRAEEGVRGKTKRDYKSSHIKG